AGPPAVRPDQWGSSNRKTPKPGGRVTWDHDVAQETPFYEGQLVSHGIFGAGRVVRVEGAGGDMLVTVDFGEVGRKHINPRFAALIPVE
ncbi:MAG: hypothetical protein IH621_11460, partial [Krumholzibacteria bacterium]|nr:hypothetical protein [Candidatus Krumholzibacteria bacterium]